MPGSTRGSALPEAGRTPLLEVQDLSVTFRTEEGLVRAVDSVSLSVSPGEVVGIVGESGSGKTVSMLAVMRLIRDPNAVIEGHVFHRGRDLLQLSKSEIRSVRGAEIAMVFQDPMTSLTPVYTVGWQIAEQVRAHEPMSAKRARARAVELLAEVGISNPERRADDFPHQFSGGMRQRVMIAMALSCNPSLLIADEPTTALDVTIQAQILELMKRLQRDHGSSIVLITHDIGVVADIAERVVVMYSGRVVEEGPRDAVFRDPQHPYTWGLLGSIPRVDRSRVARLAAIPGAPPSPFDLREGCLFEPRCPHRFDRCATRPELRERVAAGRKDACHLEPAVRPALRRASLRGESVREAG
jgi:peptide/nickel transport system ATP-binding protein